MEGTNPLSVIFRTSSVTELLKIASQVPPGQLHYESMSDCYLTQPLICLCARNWSVTTYKQRNLAIGQLTLAVTRAVHHMSYNLRTYTLLAPWKFIGRLNGERLHNGALGRTSVGNSGSDI